MYTDTKQMSVIIITNDLYLCCNTSHKLSGTTNYRIAGDFRGRKLSWIACLCRAKEHHAPKFRGENFRE